MKAVPDFIFFGSKITEDTDCSHEIKRQLLLVRKAMASLDNIPQNRHHLDNKGQSDRFSSNKVWL